MSAGWGTTNHALRDAVWNEAGMTDPLKKCETHSPHVTLKEYFEARLNALDALRLQEANVLKIQALEYERRLENLNHEAKRIDDAAGRSVSRDVFDTFLRADGAWKSQSERDRSGHLPRAEYEVQHKALQAVIQVNSDRLILLETAIAAKKQGLSTAAAIAISVFAAMSAVAAIGTFLVNAFR